MGYNSISLPFSISFSTVGRILGMFLGERCREGDYWLMVAYLVLVPLPGWIVIDVEVRHIDVELDGVKLSGVLNPIAFMTLNVVKEIQPTGLGEVIEAKGKTVLLVKFDAVLLESVDIAPLLLHIS